ncbi:hypothetical protein A3746_26000 [Oleibacter sp. HI0075]|nr:hypothetical protein A3746_04350 [Oleibacter sp. HI0075]KZZ11928.1 hypothetical protein A3746_26000 [Oleibacter sp. HI0075]|tara:strand:- start:238 stop:771 length:534 start_codon:yes stop_codon:yes gene_type:complete
MARKRIARKPSRHVAKTTLLVVGEGPDDQAFIKHLNRLFREESAPIRAKIQKESGGSPGNIITNTTRKYKNDGYDKRYIVLDSDIEVPANSRRLAEAHGYTLILWSPMCLEGALLDVLGEPVSSRESSADLKHRLHPRLKAQHTEPEAYEDLFTKTVIDSASNDSMIAVKNALLDRK